MIVVIPTARSINLDYLTPLIEVGARFLIVDDSEGSVSVSHPQFEVYNWGDRRKYLGNLEHGIPKKNGACRDFGFYLAWKESDVGEIIIALDDDCAVEDPHFAAKVTQILSDAPRPKVQHDGRHLNILDLYKDIPGPLFPRGFPYSSRVGYQPCRFISVGSGNVVFSLGLWQNVFDINAVDKLQGIPYSHPEAQLHHESALIPPGSLISVCSMNMHFRREVIPAVYQLPMHVETMPGWVIDRYGDIWGGFILKLLIDLRSDRMAAGGPMIRHLKEGNFQRNIWQEHLCHLVNDEFIDLLLNAQHNIQPAGYLDMMDALTDQIRRATPKSSGLLRPYLVHLADCMSAWVSALRR